MFFCSILLEKEKSSTILSHKTCVTSIILSTLPILDILSYIILDMDMKSRENKTKYFCSDSMMKYALREGLERAKRELRKS